MNDNTSASLLTSCGPQGHTGGTTAAATGSPHEGPEPPDTSVFAVAPPLVRESIKVKVINYVHRATTTHRAMPSIWFDAVVVASLAVPMSMWLDNHTMMVLAAWLETLLMVWYALGSVPARKPARRAVTVAPRTRKTTRKTSISTRAAV